MPTYRHPAERHKSPPIVNNTRRTLISVPTGLARVTEAAASQSAGKFSYTFVISSRVRARTIHNDIRRTFDEFIARDARTAEIYAASPRAFHEALFRGRASAEPDRGDLGFGGRTRHPRDTSRRPEKYDAAVSATRVVGREAPTSRGDASREILLTLTPRAD